MPDQQATLYAKVSGYLQSISVDKGDRVNAGAVVARIEVPELLSSRAKQQAELRAAEAEYARLEESLKRAPDLVVPLLVDQSRGRMEVARASLEQSETMLRYATLTAPFAGIVTQRFVDPGALIQAGASNGAAIITLMDFRKVRLQVRSTGARGKPRCRGSASVRYQREPSGQDVRRQGSTVHLCTRPGEPNHARRGQPR